MKNEGRKLKRENFGPLLKDVIEASIRPEIIQNGFRSCGLFPLDANGINYGKYFKATEKIVSRETNKAHENLQITTKLLQILENKIGSEKLDRFKESGLQWEGDIRDTSLYVLWRELTDDIEVNHQTDIPSCQEKNPTEDMLLNREISENITTTSSQEENPIEETVHGSEILENVSDNGRISDLPEATRSEETPEKNQWVR